MKAGIYSLRRRFIFDPELRTSLLLVRAFPGTRTGKSAVLLYSSTNSRTLMVPTGTDHHLLALLISQVIRSQMVQHKPIQYPTIYLDSGSPKEFQLTVPPPFFKKTKRCFFPPFFHSFSRPSLARQTLTMVCL